MTRERYIERLIAIYKLRYKPSETEIQEFKLLLEMMPDKTHPYLDMPTAKRNNPFYPPVTLMYGVQVPDTLYNESNSTAYTISKTDEKGK